jgi:hypothetical protein
MRSLGAIIVENVEFAQWETDAQRRDDEEWHHAFRVQLRNSKLTYPPESPKLRLICSFD